MTCSSPTRNFQPGFEDEQPNRYNDPMKWSLWNLMVLAMVGPPLLSAVNSQVRGSSELGPLVILGWLFAFAILVDRPKSHR